ncbi:sulfotransferase family 2 domain-containing protein [Actibacterium lipolyticum]|uniref:Sulfotransferase family protein n=1 Tax=Actibacterium lipolyticum TaxID=1524263 RepID=A0A238KVQ3_9RHOB|nr:sulfotransferase family 2 domain-containing protein [Actibacterium lipolyticum]SMX46923.1 Sulfotransferase family protein [Actibacterium lipolyticum]
MTTIVFLHIPKTAGQTIHNELVKVVGGEKYVSPIRVHTQAPKGPQMPAGYRLYSGHINWTEIDTLPEDRFTFTVLRDPRERIASFYFYLLKEAQKLSPEELELPGHKGKKVLLEQSADDYFFGGKPPWQKFILDHYDNFYCSYFATRKMRGRAEIAGLPVEERLSRARAGLDMMQGIYSTNSLVHLETDIEIRFGKKISVAGKYHNAGNHPTNEARWPKLVERLERDSSIKKLEAFATLDEVLMSEILPD